MSHERISISNGSVVLEGALHLPDGQPPFAGVVLCHPHPQYGGDMNNNVVAAMDQGLFAQGIATLRFNFRGVGGSTGVHDGRDGEQSDVAAALRTLRERDEIDDDRVGLAGYSFGASMALAAAPHEPDLLAVAAIAPPTPGLDAPALLADARPKLILAGDMDSFIPIQKLHELTRRMEPPPEVHVLHGGDHFLAGHEPEIAERVGAFFAGVLLNPSTS